MIGVLLYYGLYPLSRYLTSRRSGVSSKSLLPAVAHGTAVWDGGAIKTERFTPSQTAPLEQGLSPGIGSMGETKERMSAQNQEDFKRPNTDKTQLTAVVHGEIKSEPALRMNELKEGEEMKVDKALDKTAAPEHKVGAGDSNVFELEQTAKDGTAVTTEDISLEKELTAQFESLQVEDSIQVADGHCQDKIIMQTPEESVLPSLDAAQCHKYPVGNQSQSLGSLVAALEPCRQESECWDEYAFATDEEMPLELNEQYEMKPGWHFPAGPGLVDEVQCPSWDFPAMSYYPSPSVPFEVMWRVWEESDDGESAAEPTLLPFTNPCMDFTVMSYNILAQDLLEANQELYTHCPLEVLDWSHRCSLLTEELQKWAPDILCLQEVQENHYYEQLHPLLCQMGYTCIYKRRTGDRTDGCVTCYRGTSFSEVSSTPLEFFRPETEVLDRHNVGIVLLLRPVVTQGSKVKAQGPLLCVANTHLLFNPRRGDVKLAQLAIVLAEVHKVVKSCKARGEHCNVIMCGDFNSLPHTPLYQLISTGELYFHGLPAWMVSGQEDLSYKAHCHKLFSPLWPSSLGITDCCRYEAVKTTNEAPDPVSGKCQYSHDFLLQLRFSLVSCVRPKDLELIPGVTDRVPDASMINQPYERSFRHTISHCLDLESVYKHILPGSGSSEITTLHSEGGATVDYIFYSPKRIGPANWKDGGGNVSEGLKLIGCLSLLSEDVLWSMTGLPNYIFPSDHLSLLAKFRVDLNAA